MKPLPLLLSLSALALVGGLLLVATHSENKAGARSLPSAPLPVSSGFDDDEGGILAAVEPLVQPPLLSEDLVPDPQLVSFVEKAVGRSFAEIPIFHPVDENEIVTTARQGLTAAFSEEGWETLKLCANRLGVLPEFADLEHIVLTLAAAEVRGLVAPDRNLIRSDFDSGSPPEQAALVNLLARRLLSQGNSSVAPSTPPDHWMAIAITHHLLALAVERKFREELPDYPPSLNENIRESIMLGVPSFFHELASFAEFQLLDRINLENIPEAVSSLTRPQITFESPSQMLLAYPRTPRPARGDQFTDAQRYYLGPIALHIMLLEATTTEEAGTLARSLVSDSIAQDEDGKELRWTLSFEKEEEAATVKRLMETYFSFRKHEVLVAIREHDTSLIISAQERE